MYDNQLGNSDSGSGSEDEAAQEPKGKKRKQSNRRKVIKDPNAPKKPKSAYLFFCDQERPKLQARGDLTFGEVGKELGKQWKVTTDRRKFEVMAVEDKARYDEQMEDYDAPPVRYKNEKGKKYKDPNHPKKGKSAYLFFCEIERPKLEAAEMTFGEVGKELGRRWKEVPEAEKAIFKAQAAEDKARYEDEMEDYEPPPDPSTKKKKRDPDAPKKNKSAYLYFCDAERPKLQARKDLTFGEVGKELGRMWKLKTNRSQFEAMAAADKIRYETQMASYRS